jgi:hypothetical protein
MKNIDPQSSPTRFNKSLNQIWEQMICPTYGNSTLNTKQRANSKAVQMVMRLEHPQAEPERMAPGLS